jgi:mono/diheme cytochrome c family protein
VSRAPLNLIIDSAAAALLTAMVGTGYILWFVLPPGTNRTHTLWGALRHQWGVAHFWIAVTLLAVLAVHVALHWRWLVTGLSRRFGLTAWAERSPRLAGLAVLSAAALPLASLALAAHLSVRRMDVALHPLGEEPGGRTAPVTGLEPGGSRDALTGRIAELLERRCARCHGGRGAAGGVRADTPEALRAEQNSVRWIAPGNPDGSRLFEVVGVEAAAQGAKAEHRLTQGEMDALRAWIASLGG